MHIGNPPAKSREWSKSSPSNDTSGEISTKDVKSTESPKLSLGSDCCNSGAAGRLGIPAAARTHCVCKAESMPRAVALLCKPVANWIGANSCARETWSTADRSENSRQSKRCISGTTAFLPRENTAVPVHDWASPPPQSTGRRTERCAESAGLATGSASAAAVTRVARRPISPKPSATTKGGNWSSPAPPDGAMLGFTDSGSTWGRFRGTPRKRNVLSFKPSSQASWNTKVLADAGHSLLDLDLTSLFRNRNSGAS
mmetsp:Transcript_110592/g.253253  ORF Transcript_110592/g.253253 Transcript_110592/m.253253 type:complete len:256 (+) Transcript_110592:373-1140(+)